MRAQSLIAVFFSVSFVVACGGTPSSSEESEAQTIASTQQALRPIGSDPLPVDTHQPPPAPQPCQSLRYDLYRNSGQTCALPPAAAGGTWSMQPLFPNAPAAIRDRLCAYTWTPTGNTPSCAAAPIGSIAHSSSEQLGARGHCPMNQSGCGTTTVDMGGGGWTVQPNVLATMALESTAMVAKTAAVPPTAFAQIAAASAGTAVPSEIARTTGSPSGSSSSGGTTVPGNGAVPLAGVGCCDACAELQDHYTFAVLPENTGYGTVYFDAPYTAPGGAVATERITVPHPATNVIQVNLNPSRSYLPGMIWAIHTTN